MFNQLRPLRALQRPKIFFYQLQQEEGFTGFWPRFSILIIVSVLIHFFYAFYGIGSEVISKEIYGTPNSEFAMKKMFFAGGQVLFGILFPFVIIFVSSLFFWCLTDAPFRKLMVLHEIVLLILLLEKAVFIPIAIIVGIQPESSPFGLGVIMQYITSADLLHSFFGAISLFKIWGMVFQYYGLKVISSKEPKALFLIVLSFNLFIWLVSALLSYIPIENII